MNFRKNHVYLTKWHVVTSQVKSFQVETFNLNVLSDSLKNLVKESWRVAGFKLKHSIWIQLESL